MNMPISNFNMRIRSNVLGLGVLALSLVVACGAQDFEDGDDDSGEGVLAEDESSATSNSGGKCSVAREGTNAKMSCPSGQVISSITFASYGTPSGTCQSGYAVSGCHAANSKSKVEAACVGRPSCTVAVSNATFDDMCHGIPKRFRAAYTCGAGDGSGGGDPGREMPVFLLAGQSNMVGSVDADLFRTLIDELGRGTDSDRQARLVSHLHNWYFNTNGGYASYGYSDAMAAFEASELIRLRAAGLANSGLTSPHSKVLCSMNEATVAPLTTNCGSAFGPELMLGHVLGKSASSPTSLIKVAQGGTSLFTDWRSPRSGGTVGPLYTQLRSRIQSLQSSPASVHPSCTSQKCRWGAFIWFQGENDSFDRANADAYAQNLRDIIADVRSDVGSSTLPVVIVQTGKWAQSLDFGPTVAAAQQSVVDADRYARIVKTDDLSGFYHYDPAAQLIIGERVALAVQALLK